MEKVMTIAAYIAHRYSDTYCEKIDEMKLHKLMYFAQRESFVENSSPLFDATFYGWKYGPVLKEIRGAYKDGKLFTDIPYMLENKENETILDRVFADYALKDSWSLSRLTHGELSWKNSRSGVPENANSDRPIRNEDIRLDAERIRERRIMLEKMGIQ